MKKLWITCLLFFFWIGPIWAQSEATDTLAAAKNSKIPLIQYGIASFYDNKFEGRLTSNGEVFTQKKLTAASNTLPLNCWVKVTNLSNKRSVILRITDRMHPKNKRLIDLSRSAASSLSYTGKGLTRVKVEYLGKKKPASLQTDKVNK
ncbi:MAG: septal ring lytic transglycosylase RlpA family protein [Chitinophagaceae bacterium]|nr:septal ring lytic transglycosylase RlpA family protein [Chitinophagaceae bacterium]